MPPSDLEASCIAGIMVGIAFVGFAWMAINDMRDAWRKRRERLARRARFDIHLPPPRAKD